MIRKTLFIALSVVVAAEVLSAVFLHVYTRINKKVKADTPIVQYWEYDPYLLWSAKAGVAGFDRYSRFKMNNFGFRNDRDISKEKPDGTYRIIVIGGSGAWGTGASSNNTVWTSVVEDLLRKERCNVEVLNAGCAGYISFQELMYLQFKLLEFSPDMIIVFDGYNDVYMSSLYGTAGYTANVSPYYDVEKQFNTEPLIFQIGGLIKQRSNLFRLARRIREKIMYESGRPMFPFVGVNERGIEAYFSNVKSMADIFRGRGIQGIFLLQPYIAASKKDLSPDEVQMLNKARRESEVVMDAYETLRSRYRDFAARERIVYHDLTDIFDSIDGSETVWYDHVHLNDLGHRTLANRVKDIIAAYCPKEGKY